MGEERWKLDSQLFFLFPNLWVARPISCLPYRFSLINCKRLRLSYLSDSRRNAYLSTYSLIHLTRLLDAKRGMDWRRRWDTRSAEFYHFEHFRPGQWFPSTGPNIIDCVGPACNKMRKIRTMWFRNISQYNVGRDCFIFWEYVLPAIFSKMHFFLLNYEM